MDCRVQELKERCWNCDVDMGVTLIVEVRGFCSVNLQVPCLASEHFVLLLRAGGAVVDS